MDFRVVIGHERKVKGLCGPMNSLKNKVALVTGVTRRQGIGAAVALALAERGADICTGYLL